MLDVVAVIAVAVAVIVVAVFVDCLNQKQISYLPPIQMHHRGAEKLFADLANEFEFEQSMRPFYSTASSTIPNDQKSFAEFCYGSMISCKEGNLFACARDNPQYRNQ